MPSTGSYIIFIFFAVLVCLCVSLDPNISSETYLLNRNAGICSNIEIWSPVDESVANLKNCTVVEGYVRLMQFDMKTIDRANISFPNLKEIVGYLMIFRISGLDSLGELFPNLSVIRGNSLFDTYALIIFELFDLKTISFTSLTNIIQGDIFIASNVNLCFVETVDWNLIAPGSRKNYISGNKSPNECPVCGNCSKSVPSKLVSCWNVNVCQNFCPSICSTNCNADGSCCHPSCLGGCWNDGPEGCYSCKHYLFHNSCVESCPENTYVFSGWRCISEFECYNLPRHNGKLWKPFNGQCLLDCPQGYHEQDVDIGNQKRLQCQKCEGGLCRKECQGAFISTVEDSKNMIGCTVIKGSIIINLSEYGKNIVPELEKNLNSIEEINENLKIINSYQLTSLNFLKNLKYIRGQNLLHEYKYNLFVVGNKNLEFLWDFKHKGSGLQINGPVYFRSNPKLCVNRIQQLLNEANVSASDSFVPNLTNGVKNVCDFTELIAGYENVTSASATIFWSSFEFHDLRKLMGYAIFLKETPFKNVTVFDGRNECGGGDWKVFDVSFFDCCANNFTITKLHPFTSYAFYVKTITVNSDFGAQSGIYYFNTLPSVPSIPLGLEVNSNSSSEIILSWFPPFTPNGKITHYLVTVQQVIDIFDPIDHCEEKRLDVPTSNNSRYTEPDLGHKYNFSDLGSHKSDKLSDEFRKRLSEINFENKLQNQVYVKRIRRSFMISSDSIDNVSMSESPSDNESLILSNGISEFETDKKLVFKNKVVYGNSLYVSGLTHFTKYSVEVRACRQLMPNESHYNLDYYCSFKKTEETRTQALILSDAIRDEYPLLKVSDKIPGTVMLKWEEPQTPNGNILSYTVDYKRSGYNSLTECVSQEQFLKFGKSYVLKNLRPGNYSIRIRARSSYDHGPFTSPKYFYIKDDTSIHTYVYLSLVTLLFILPPAIAYCVYYLKKTEKNKLFISVNPEYTHKTYIPDAWEIPRNQIDLIKEIGQGSFGMVYEGLLNSKPCAVKTVNAQASENEKKEFLNEASVMKAFDTYHVVKLLGVVSSGEPVYVVMELMPNGDLKSFLRSHRPDVCDPHVRPPSIRRLLQMSVEIADGMAYLSAKKYVHRDLAARNCMVSENLTVKIGDFGMARDIYVGDYYRKGSRGLMPVRWMAPESLKDGIFLSASDVWSYGIVLYEMVTLAAQPYQGLTNDQVLRYVMDGGIMERPENCADKMYTLMRKCWRQNPNSRPTFLEIVEMLHEDASLNFHVVSFYDSEEGREHRQSAEANIESCKRIH